MSAAEPLQAPSLQGWRKWILPWLHGYQRSWIRPDIIAGRLDCAALSSGQWWSTRPCP